MCFLICPNKCWIKVDFWTQWEKERVAWFEKIALKHTHCHMLNRWTVRVRCMKRAPKASALGQSRRIGWGWRWEWGSGCEGHRYKEQTFGLREKARVALKHVYYHMWNRWPVQVQCIKQGTQSQCIGTTLRDGMLREMGGSFTVGATCTPVADSCQCIPKTTTVL